MAGNQNQGFVTWRGEVQKCIKHHNTKTHASLGRIFGKMVSDEVVRKEEMERQTEGGNKAVGPFLPHSGTRGNNGYNLIVHLLLLL